jgi:hypothetical protein
MGSRRANVFTRVAKEGDLEADLAKVKKSIIPPKDSYFESLSLTSDAPDWIIVRYSTKCTCILPTFEGEVNKTMTSLGYTPSDWSYA